MHDLETLKRLNNERAQQMLMDRLDKLLAKPCPDPARPPLYFGENVGGS